MYLWGIGYSKKKIVVREPDSDTIFYKFTEFMTHGGIPILMVFDLYRYPYTIANIIYPITFSIMWLTLVILPWYYITGDPVYPFLHKDVPLYFKLSIISNILLINLISGYIGYFISNYNIPLDNGSKN